LASVVQYIGHLVGTLVAMLLLWAIGRRRLLEDWYGWTAVELARDRTFDRRRRTTFWLLASCGLAAGLAWGAADGYLDFIQRIAVGTFGGVLAGSVVVRRPTAESRR
jgi:hypothetical protein